MFFLLLTYHAKNDSVSMRTADDSNCFCTTCKENAWPWITKKSDAIVVTSKVVGTHVMQAPIYYGDTVAAVTAGW